jgi:hypothetical protein
MSFGLLAAALGAASPALAEHPEGSPLNPRSNQHWIMIGRFTGPFGHGDGYTDLSAENTQPAAMPKGQYLVDLWMVLDRPYISEEGATITEEKLNFRVDCPSRSFGDDGGWEAYGPDGSVVDRQDSGEQAYSLSKPDSEDEARARVIDAFCG